MKCPNCYEELCLVETIKQGFCAKCQKTFTKKELKEFQFIEQMNEDHEIYKRNMKFKGC